MLAQSPLFGSSRALPVVSCQPGRSPSNPCRPCQSSIHPPCAESPLGLTHGGQTCRPHAVQCRQDTRTPPSTAALNRERAGGLGSLSLPSSSYYSRSQPNPTWRRLHLRPPAATYLSRYLPTLTVHALLKLASCSSCWGTLVLFLFPDCRARHHTRTTPWLHHSINRSHTPQLPLTHHSPALLSLHVHSSSLSQTLPFLYFYCFRIIFTFARLSPRESNQ